MTTNHRVVVVEIPPQTKPVRFVLNADHISAEYFNPAHLRFVFEEHACPSDFVKKTHEIYYDDQEDPHEVFRFVECREVTRDEELEWFDDDGQPVVATELTALQGRLAMLEAALAKADRLAAWCSWADHDIEGQHRQQDYESARRELVGRP